MRALHDLLKPQRLTAILDIGGADLQGNPPYQRMLDEGVCTVGNDVIVGPIDLLKITGPFDSAILANAEHDTVAAHVSVAFFPTYTFGEVDGWMRSLGFILHCFADAYIVPIQSGTSVPHPDPHQIAQADLFYVLDFLKDMSDEQWKHLALIAHHVCGSYDLAMLAVSKLSEKGVIASDAPAQYRRMLEAL